MPKEERFGGAPGAELGIVTVPVPPCIPDIPAVPIPGIPAGGGWGIPAFDDADTVGLCGILGVPGAATPPTPVEPENVSGGLARRPAEPVAPIPEARYAPGFIPKLWCPEGL